MSMECWSDDFMLLLAKRMGVRSRSCSFHDSMARFATSKVRRVWFVNGTAYACWSRVADAVIRAPYVRKLCPVRASVEPPFRHPLPLSCFLLSPIYGINAPERPCQCLHPLLHASSA